MSKAKLLNLSVESFDSPQGDATVAPVYQLVPANEIFPVPSPVSQDADLDRLRVIADALDGVQDGLGSRIATIGAQVLGGGDGVGVEAFNPGAVGKAISNFVDVAIAYIKKFIAAVLEFGRRYVETRRYERQSAIDMQKVVGKFVQQNRGFTTVVSGPGADFLSFGSSSLTFGTIAGPGELAKAAKAFQTEVHTPYLAWFKENVDILKKVNDQLDRIFKAGSLATAPEEPFTALIDIKASEPPRGWKAGGSRKTAFTAPSGAWGGAEFFVTATSSTPISSLSAHDACDLNVDSNDTSATVSGDLLNEYAKMAVGLVDMQIALAAPYDVIQTVAKNIFDNYSRKFVDSDFDINDATLMQKIGARNSQLNNIMGYVSYVMTCVAGYMSYLNATRRAIGDMCTEVTTIKK